MPSQLPDLVPTQHAFYLLKPKTLSGLPPNPLSSGVRVTATDCEVYKQFIIVLFSITLSIQNIK